MRSYLLPTAALLAALLPVPAYADPDSPSCHEPIRHVRDQYDVAGETFYVVQYNYGPGQYQQLFVHRESNDVPGVQTYFDDLGGCFEEPVPADAEVFASGGSNLLPFGEI